MPPEGPTIEKHFPTFLAGEILLVLSDKGSLGPSVPLSRSFGDSLFGFLVHSLLLKGRGGLLLRIEVLIKGLAVFRLNERLGGRIEIHDVFHLCCGFLIFRALDDFAFALFHFRRFDYVFHRGGGCGVMCVLAQRISHAVTEDGHLAVQLDILDIPVGHVESIPRSDKDLLALQEL